MSDASGQALLVALPCDGCGYDVRAQPADGVCPECRTPIEQSRRVARLPHRPAWRDSDPRWRRRMVAGAWVLVLVPLMDLLRAFGWAGHVPVPIFSDIQRGQMLDDSFAAWVYPYLMFCIGVVLLFARERNRRRARLDWTRRWGIVASYCAFLFFIPDVACVTALVLAGIAALFQSMPPMYQPAITGWLGTIAGAYLRHGPPPTSLSIGATAACSAIAVLLACVPLFNALRSCGPRVTAAILVAPLALGALWQTAGAVLLAMNVLNVANANLVYSRASYFAPRPLTDGLASLHWHSGTGTFLFEAAKWLACFSIAARLSVAQLAAKRRRGA